MRRENNNRNALPIILSSPEPAKEISKFRAGVPQILAVSVKNILLLGYGMTLGFPTIIIPAIQGGDGRDQSTHGEIILNKDQISWLSSINLICVPLGCIFSGPFTQPIGRRRAMQIVNIPLLISWLLFYYSSNVYHLYGALCLAGLSGGLLEAPVLTYVAEVTQPRFRGMLAASGSLCAISGVFSQFVMGTFLTWRTVALCNCCLPFISVVSLLFIPESPHWLILKKRFDDAKRSLAWLRGWVPIEKIEPEYEHIKEHLQLSHTPENKHCLKNIRLYTKSNFLKPYGLICLTFFIGHFSGMTTLQTYAVQIFNTLKAPINEYYATLLLGLAQLFGAIMCVTLVHYTGKRPLVFISLFGCFLCFFGTAIYAFLLNSVPGTDIHNIIGNASSLNTNEYINIIPLNRSSIHHNYDIVVEDNLTSITTNFPTFNEYEFMENSTDADYSKMTTLLNYDDDDGAKNITNLFNISMEHDSIFNNQEITVFSLNESSYDFFNFLDTFNTTSEDNIESIMKQTKNLSIVFNNSLVPIPEIWINKYLWLPLILLIGCALLSHIGIRLIPWILIGEVFPSSVRNVASGISSGSGYVFGFLANKLFLNMVATLTLPGTFLFYSMVNLVGTAILYFVLPETEGRTLHEIETHFSGGKKLIVGNCRKKILNDHEDRTVKHSQIVIAPAPDNSISVEGVQEQLKASQRRRKVNNLNFDVNNWESKLKCKRHFQERNLNPELERVLRNQKMGLKKNKLVHTGKVKSGLVSNKNENTHL